MPAPPACSDGFPGPRVFGRGIVVRPGQRTPTAFVRAPFVRVDAESVTSPADLISRLHRAWLHRTPIIVEVVDEVLQVAPPPTPAEPHQVGPLHELVDERLRFLLWANNYDVRSGTPQWHAAISACALGLLRPLPVSHRAKGDAATKDGLPVWIDGGPIGLPLSHTIGHVIHTESIEIGHVSIRSNTQSSARTRSDGHAVLAGDQHAAVTHGVGGARVIAPAGSGKTRVLTARIHQLIDQHRVEPERITAVAYNVRAADELRERVGRGGVNIRTIHALGNAVVALAEDRRVLTSNEANRLLATVLRREVAGHHALDAYREAFTHIRIGLRATDDVSQRRGDVPALAEMLRRYRQALRDHRALDFDEQLFRAIELLLQDPGLRARARHHTAHLLVDEVQDLTPAFVLFLRLLAGPRQQIFAVGDDDQTIYSHTGASSKWLIDFSTWVTEPGHYALAVNYRCPGDVVGAADRLLRANRIRLNKSIAAAHADRHGMAIHHVGTQERTAFLQDRVAHTESPHDCAVLARTNIALLVAQVALAEAGIAASAPLAPSALRRVGLATPRAYLRIARQPDRIRHCDLALVLRRPARKLASTVLPLVRRGVISQRRLRLMRPQLDRDHRRSLRRLLDELDWLNTLARQGASAADLLVAIGSVLGVSHASGAMPVRTAQHDDLDMLRALAAIHADPATFDRWLHDRLALPATPHGVVLTTIHRVKGREWDHVIIDGVTRDLLPHRHANDVEEERRCFHVALTRCRKQVDLIVDPAAPSPFVAELFAATPRYSARKPAMASASDSTGSNTIEPRSKSSS